MLRVCLNCYGNHTTDSVFQWDQNHTLEISGLNIEDISGVHFCNKKRDTAIVVTPTIGESAITVPVPNELLQEPYNIIAYIHAYADNHAKTIEIINIPLIKRAKPDDYEFTENVDIVNFERLEKDIVDFIAEQTAKYEAFTRSMETEINDFETNFTNEYNDRVESGYFLNPDCATELNIMKTKNGGPLFLENSADGLVFDFHGYGDGIQESDPTPNAPIDIKNIGVAINGMYALIVKSEGKNLLCNTATTQTINGVTFTVNDDKSVSVNGTATATVVLPIGTVRINDNDKVICNGSPLNSSVPTNYVQIKYTLNNGEYKSYAFGGGSDYVIDNNIGIVELEYRIVVYSGNTVNATYYPMIRFAEVDDSAYESYKENSVYILLSEPLRGVGTVKDEICCIDGVYGVLRRITRARYDGSSDERWSTNGTYSNTFYSTLIDFSALSKNILCDYFGTISTPTNSDYGIAVGTYLNFKNIDISTLDDWIAWLAENPIVVDYVRLEPVFEPFEDQVIFKNIVTYDSVTYITASDNADMRISYYINSTGGQQLAKEYIRLNKTIEKTNILDENNLLLKRTLGYTIKNELPTFLNSESNIDGVSVLLNDDNSFTLNGTVTSKSINASNWIGPVISENTEYILSGCPSGGSKNSYYLAINYYDENDNLVTAYDYGEGVRFKTGSSYNMNITLYINSGVTFNNSTFYPMLRRADIEDNTYEPFINSYDVNKRLVKLETKTKDNGWEILVGSGSYTDFSLTNPIRFRKKSEILYINGRIDYITKSNTVIATLSEDYRPSTNMWFPAIGYSSDLSTAIPVDIAIATNGSVSVNTRGSTTYVSTIYINIVCPL